MQRMLALGVDNVDVSALLRQMERNGLNREARAVQRRWGHMWAVSRRGDIPDMT